MSDLQSENRAAWKARLVTILKPHLRGDEDGPSDAVEAVLAALEAAHREGLREAASFCRQVATAAHRQGEVAKAPADGIEALAKQTAVAEAARQRQAC